MKHLNTHCHLVIQIILFDVCNTINKQTHSKFDCICVHTIWSKSLLYMTFQYILSLSFSLAFSISLSTYATTTFYATLIINTKPSRMENQSFWNPNGIVGFDAIHLPILDRPILCVTIDIVGWRSNPWSLCVKYLCRSLLKWSMVSWFLGFSF